MPDKTHPVLWRIAALALSAVGLASSAYLFVRVMLLQLEMELDTTDVCGNLFGWGCDRTLLWGSPTQLGIPIAGWGVVYFVVLSALLVLSWVFRRGMGREADVAAMLFAVVGLGISLTLAGVMFWGTAPFCPLCLLVHGVNLALLPVLKVMSGLSPRELGRTLADGVRYAVGKTSADAERSNWKVLGFVNVALVAIVTYQWVYVETELRRKPRSTVPTQSDFMAIVRDFQKVPREQIPLREDDPRIGPQDAPAQLVVFSNFKCGGCRTFAGLCRTLSNNFRDKLCVTFKHFPLREECTVDPDPDSPQTCSAAFAAEAARSQGRFWQFHDALYELSTDGADEAIQAAAQQTGLKLERFAADRLKRELRQRVVDDAELGRSMGVAATPTVFLNGRRVPPTALNANSMFALVASEMAVQEALGGRVGE